MRGVACAAEGRRPALLTGGQIRLVNDRRWVSCMCSYPNLIALSDAEVGRIVETLGGYPYERIYSLCPGRATTADEPAALQPL